VNEFARPSGVMKAGQRMLRLTWMLSFIKQMLPLSVRVNLWRLRNKSQNLRQRLNHRLTGRCHVCQGKNFDRYSNPVVARLPFSFYICTQCGFIFALPPSNLSEVYAEITTTEFGEGEATWNRHYLDSINKYTNAPGKLLEIGFGNGSFLKLAHEEGWEVYGAELSAPLVNHAREELKLPNIGLGTIEELNYADGSFDVVAGFNFIEHVPDPKGTLEGLWRILKPSGIVVLMCPNISGIYHLLMPEILADNDPLKISWVPPHHLSYFNKTNLRILLENSRFTVVGDESHLMSSLWRQFEVNIGPKVTDSKLQQLISEIRDSPSQKGEARVEKYREAIKSLLVERMTWTMLSDLSALEPLLGAEVGVLLLGKKQG